MSRADEIVSKSLKEKVPEFEVGDSVDVQVRIKEGDKTRIQLFSGLVIRITGTGIRRNFTVRRIVQGEGVERIFPLHSPSVADVVVRKKGRVRRARLYYLRERTGKATRLRERVWAGGKRPEELEGDAHAPAPSPEQKAAAAPKTDAGPAAKPAPKAEAKPAKAAGEQQPKPASKPEPAKASEPKAQPPAGPKGGSKPEAAKA